MTEEQFTALMDYIDYRVDELIDQENGRASTCTLDLKDDLKKLLVGDSPVAVAPCRYAGAVTPVAPGTMVPTYPLAPTIPIVLPKGRP